MKQTNSDIFVCRCMRGNRPFWSVPVCLELKIFDILLRLVGIIVLVLASHIILFAQDQPEISFQNGIKYITHTSIGKWENKKVISCSLVQTIGINQKNSEGYLQGPMAIFVDWDNSVYVADENKIKIYDKNGDLFQVLSENSMKGPGSIIADSAGKIYVECSRVSKVYVFSKQGEFIKSIDMPKYEEGLLYNFKTNRKFALYSPFCKTLNDPQIQGPIVPFTDNGIEAPSFGEPLQFDPRMRYDTGITMACKVLSDGRIAVSYLYPFAVQIYSANGVLQTVITRTDTLFTESFEFVLRGYRFKLSARRMNGIRSFPDGKFMIAYLDRGSDWKERAKKGDVSSYPGMIYDLYDSTGVFLQEFKQPRNVMGMLGPVDRKGFVYSTSYPKYPAKAGDFVINKYCIEFKDK